MYQKHSFAIPLLLADMCNIYSNDKFHYNQQWQKDAPNQWGKNPDSNFFSLYCILKYFTKILIVLDLICPERWTEASLMIYYFCIETLLGSSEPAPEITIVNITYDLGPHTFISDTCYLTFCKQPLKVGKQSKRAWKSHRSMLDSRGEKLDVVWMSAW